MVDSHCRRCGKEVVRDLKPHRCRKLKLSRPGAGRQEQFWCDWGCCDGARCKYYRKARKFRTSW